MDEYVCPRCGTPPRGASTCSRCAADLDALDELPRASEYAAGGIRAVTAEHAEHLAVDDGVPAGVLVRWLALVVDSVLAIFPALLGALAFAALGQDEQTGVEVAVLLWLVVYPPVMLALAGGQTLGKRALGLRVEGTDGGSIGLGRAIVRESLLKLAFTLIPLGLVFDAIVARSDARRRSIHDRAVDTCVVTVAGSRI